MTMSDAAGSGGRLEKARGSRHSGERKCLSGPPWIRASALPGPVHKSQYLRPNIKPDNQTFKATE